MLSLLLLPPPPPLLSLSLPHTFSHCNPPPLSSPCWTVQIGAAARWSAAAAVAAAAGSRPQQRESWPGWTWGAGQGTGRGNRRGLSGGRWATDNLLPSHCCGTGSWKAVEKQLLLLSSSSTPSTSNSGKCLPQYHQINVCRQTCLPQNTSVSSPKCQCPYFQIFYWIFFFRIHHQSIKTKESVKGQFFYHTSCKKSVWTHIFNYTDALQNWHTMTLGCLYFVNIDPLKLFWIKDHRTFSPKAMHHVYYCFCWCPRVYSWTVVVWSEQSFLVFLHSYPSLSVSCCYLSLTASYSNLPYLKMANFIKLWMPSQCSLVSKTLLTNQDQLYTSDLEMALKYTSVNKWQFHQCSTIAFSCNKLSKCSRHDFCTFWKLFDRILRNTHVLPADFCTNTAKYRWVGRSAVGDGPLWSIYYHHHHCYHIRNLHYHHQLSRAISVINIIM